MYTKPLPPCLPLSELRACQLSQERAFPWSRPSSLGVALHPAVCADSGASHLLASRLDTACAARALDTVIPTLGQYETIFWIPFHCPDVGHPRPHPPRALGSSPPRVNPHPYQKPRKCLVRKPSVILGSADGPWVAPTGHLTFQMAASWEKSFSFQTPLPPFIRDFEILEDSDKY